MLYIDAIVSNFTFHSSQPAGVWQVAPPEFGTTKEFGVFFLLKDGERKKVNSRKGKHFN